MVVNVIINSILDSGMGYKEEEFYVPALFRPVFGKIVCGGGEYDHSGGGGGRKMWVEHK